MDYLVEEVLDLQPQNVQNFLLQTSILERLNGPLCDTVCSSVSEVDRPSTPDQNPAEDGQKMLEFLERSNLFVIPLDEERKWYRYHHLFASLLRARLVHSKVSPIDALHLRAADWFEQNGYAEDAIRHALAAQDFPWAARLVEGIAESAWRNGQYSRLTGMIQLLPEDVLLDHPWLCVWTAWSFTQTGVVRDANRYIEIAEAAVQKRNLSPSSTDETSQEFQALSYEIAALKVVTACLEEDYDRAILLSAEVLKNPPPKAIKSAQIARCHIYHGLSYKYFADGDFAKAEQANLETIRISEKSGLLYANCMGPISWPTCI